MRGTVLYGTGDVRFEEVPELKINQANGCHPQARGYLLLRIGPMELSLDDRASAGTH